jgi:cytochrome o ubiquinol oxidase subunit 2
MTGMVNRLNLIANNIGEFPGSTAEMSGSGFADMRFSAKAVLETDYEKWVNNVKNSKQMLLKQDYKKLAQPGAIKEPAYYSMYQPGLYNDIVNKFMAPSGHEMEMK